MQISITGTPGTGKSTIAEILREKGKKVVNLGDWILEKGLGGEYDEKSQTHGVDIELIRAKWKGESREYFHELFVDSHLSHELDVDLILVLRCHPDILRKRLSKRDYSSEKINENVESELIDVILVEAIETETPVMEFDTSYVEQKETAQQLLEAVSQFLINKEIVNKFKPGRFDWIGEIYGKRERAE